MNLKYFFYLNAISSVELPFLLTLDQTLLMQLEMTYEP